MVRSSVPKRVAKLVGTLVAALGLVALARRTARYDLPGDADEALPEEDDVLRRPPDTVGPS
jgi:hypothetical protein